MWLLRSQIWTPFFSWLFCRCTNINGSVKSFLHHFIFSRFLSPPILFLNLEQEMKRPLFSLCLFSSISTWKNTQLLSGFVFRPAGSIGRGVIFSGCINIWFCYMQQFFLQVLHLSSAKLKKSNFIPPHTNLNINKPPDSNYWVADVGLSREQQMHTCMLIHTRKDCQSHNLGMSDFV